MLIHKKFLFLIFLLINIFGIINYVNAEERKMDNQLLELTLKRRSVRRYTNEVISPDIINEIMRVALTAPSSFGHRPVEFIVVKDKNKIKKTC